MDVDHADINYLELLESSVLKNWIKTRREPSRRHPLNVAEERANLSKMEAQIRIWETAHPSPMQKRNLAVGRYIRQLVLWRLFPFHSLPDDILLQIFRQGTFCSSDNPRGPIMPITYASICKRWRNLALDASWLWGYLGFSDSSPFRLTKLFLERSRSAPLIIEIDITDRRFDFEDDSYWPTADETIERLGLLRRHAHRWVMFYCRTDNWAPLEGALSMTQGLTTPILRRVEFAKNFGMLPPLEAMGPNPLKLFGGGAPALRELVLRNVSIDWQNLSFSNLSELELSRLSRGTFPSLRNFWIMLRNSPNLQKLVLYEAGPRWEPEIAHQFPCINLPRLKELEFKGTGSRSGGLTLEYALFVLSMFVPGPDLSVLAIGGFARNDDVTRALFLLPRFASTEELVLSDIHFSSHATTAQWLLAFPQVSRLTFEGSHTQRAVMETLAIHPPVATNLCPFLRTLTLYDVDFGATSAVIHTRLALNQPIKTLLFDISMQRETEELGPLRSLVEIGFEGDMWDEDEWIGPDPAYWAGGPGTRIED